MFRATTLTVARPVIVEQFVLGSLDNRAAGAGAGASAPAFPAKKLVSAPLCYSSDASRGTGT